MTKVKNKVTQDTALKNFWRDNERFADLFNAVLFNGKDFQSSDEFLSALKKADRLHPVITLCVYYGEEKWDGPYNLLEMLEIPEDLEGLVSDYKMNLVQIRESEQFPFKNEDVNTVFDIV